MQSYGVIVGFFKPVRFGWGITFSFTATASNGWHEQLHVKDAVVAPIPAHRSYSAGWQSRMYAIWLPENRSRPWTGSPFQRCTNAHHGGVCSIDLADSWHGVRPSGVNLGVRRKSKAGGGGGQNHAVPGINDAKKSGEIPFPKSSVLKNLEINSSVAVNTGLLIHPPRKSLHDFCLIRKEPSPIMTKRQKCQIRGNCENAKKILRQTTRKGHKKYLRVFYKKNYELEGRES